MNTEQEARAILADWTNVRVEDKRKFWLVAGTYGGTNHAGTSVDPVALAAAMNDRVRYVPPEPEPTPVVEPEPPPIPLPDLPEVAKLSDYGPVGEPEPHPFADLIDATKDNEDERLRLRGRYLFLHHMLVDQSGGLPELSDMERAELNSLQTRNKASENWLNINV